MANFSLIKDAGVRMAVLEEKLTVYEELSKEMLSKLENAVDKISEANQNVAKVLVRHEERLDQNLQSDATVMKLLEEMKEQNKETVRKVNEEIKELKTSLINAHNKISDISKYRWIFSGALLILTFIISEGNYLSRLFNQETITTPPPITSGR